MNCQRIKLPGGATAIVCGARAKLTPCAHCCVVSTLVCDWKIGAGKTCDRPLCAECALEVAPNKHLCPEHQAAWRRWRAAKEAAR